MIAPTVEMAQTHAAQLRRDARRRGYEVSEASLGAVPAETDDMIRRLREQLGQSARRRHDLSLAFTAVRIASSAANSTAMRTYAIKPL